MTGKVAAHGGGGQDFRVPTWFEGDVWEMTSKPPHGPEPTDDNSHAPIWHIASAADGKSCAQIPGFLDFSNLERDPRFTGDWGFDEDEDGNPIPGTGVHFDQTASANPFSTLWHIHWVFDDSAGPPYSPGDLVNVDDEGDPLTDTATIKNATNVDIVSIPFVFNCPIRPADEVHANYCP